MTPSCIREPEILEAALAEQLTDELLDHAASCAACGEVAKIAGLVRADFHDAQRRAQLPPATTVWVLAQIRAREEAARTAARPILLTQALAIAALVGMLVALVGRVSLGSVVWPHLTNIPTQTLVVLGVAGICWLAFTPVLLYLAFSRD